MRLPPLPPPHLKEFYAFCFEKYFLFLWFSGFHLFLLFFWKGFHLNCLMLSEFIVSVCSNVILKMTFLCMKWIYCGLFYIIMKSDEYFSRLNRYEHAHKPECKQYLTPCSANLIQRRLGNFKPFSKKLFSIIRYSWRPLWTTRTYSGICAYYYSSYYPYPYHSGLILICGHSSVSNHYSAKIYY